MEKIIKKFWHELIQKGQNKFFTKPAHCSDTVWKIQTTNDNIFEDTFWDIFHKYPFHVCHITFANRFMIIPPAEEELKYGRFFFELRFNVTDQKGGCR